MKRGRFAFINHRITHEKYIPEIVQQYYVLPLYAYYNTTKLDSLAGVYWFSPFNRDEVFFVCGKQRKNLIPDDSRAAATHTEPEQRVDRSRKYTFTWPGVWYKRNVFRLSYLNTQHRVHIRSFHKFDATVHVLIKDFYEICVHILF